MASRAPHGAFTGAGVSFADPAALPLGPELRDAVLEVCESGAEAIVPGIVTAVRGSLPVGEWKLEYVLGRLHGSAGEAALELLECLRVEVPNEAHMLLAAALARGGVHATVNLDDGVEVA